MSSTLGTPQVGFPVILIQQVWCEAVSGRGTAANPLRARWCPGFWQLPCPTILDDAAAEWLLFRGAAIWKWRFPGAVCHPVVSIEIPEILPPGWECHRI